MKLTNETVQIELKNGTIIQGTITGIRRCACHVSSLWPFQGTPHTMYWVRDRVLLPAGVDIAMNTHLKNVKLILKGQSAQPLDSMSVRGNQIRWVSLSETMLLRGSSEAH